MSELSQAELGRLRLLASSMADAMLAALVSGLEDQPGRLGAVRNLFDAERTERRVRATIFEPIRPFVEPGRGLAAPRLPAGAPDALWLLAQAAHPELCRRLWALSADVLGDDFASAANDLCRRLARGLARDSSPEVEAARTALDQDAPDGSRTAIKLLALSPHLRSAMPHLSTWTHQLTTRSTEQVRQLFAVAAKLGEEAGPLFIEGVSGHLAEPCNVLRLISLILDQPTDRFLADSPLGPAAERLMDGVKRTVEAVQGFSPGSGEGAGLGARVLAAAAALLEFELWVDVTRSGPWGGRLAELRRGLALAVEAHLKATPKLMAQALPTRAARWTQRSAPRTPRLSEAPEERAVRRAEDQAAFLAAVRKSPSTSGFAALLVQTCEEMDEQLDSYVEGLLDLLHHAAPSDRERIEAFLEVAARLTESFSGAPAGRIVRRRAAAA